MSEIQRKGAEGDKVIAQDNLCPTATYKITDYKSICTARGDLHRHTLYMERYAYTSSSNSYGGIVLLGADQYLAAGSHTSCHTPRYDVAVTERLVF